MRLLKVVFWGLFILAVLVVAGTWFGPPYLNRYQTDGEANLPGLKSEVTVTRDKNGMAYIRAQNLSDAIEAQGFVRAQDRLFQMQMTRLLAQGRICELAGEAAKPLDVMYRTIGIHRHAKRHAEILEPETWAFFQRYVDGINAFIKNYPGDVHLTVDPDSPERPSRSRPVLGLCYDRLSLSPLCGARRRPLRR